MNLNSVPEWAWLVIVALAALWLYRNGYLDNLLSKPPTKPIKPDGGNAPLPIPEPTVTIRHVVQTQDGKVSTDVVPEQPATLPTKVSITGGTVQLQEKDGVLHVSR